MIIFLTKKKGNYTILICKICSNLTCMQQSLYLVPFWHSGGPDIHEDAVPSPISCSSAHSPAGGWFPSAPDTQLWKFSKINLLLKTERNSCILKIIIWVHIYMYITGMLQITFCVYDSYYLKAPIQLQFTVSLYMASRATTRCIQSMCMRWFQDTANEEPCLCSDSANSGERLHCGCLPLLNPF